MADTRRNKWDSLVEGVRGRGEWNDREDGGQRGGGKKKEEAPRVDLEGGCCEVKVPVCGVRWPPARGRGTLQLCARAEPARWKRRLGSVEGAGGRRGESPPGSFFFSLLRHIPQLPPSEPIRAGPPASTPPPVLSDGTELEADSSGGSGGGGGSRGGGAKQTEGPHGARTYSVSE